MNNKRKVGPMRPKTQEAMVTLAEIMVKNYKLEVIKGTNQFLEYAIHEAEENDLGISWQTIKLRQEFLEMKCDELNKLPKVYDIFEDEEFYWAGGDMVEHDTIIYRALELIKMRMDTESDSFVDFDDDFVDDKDIMKQQSMNQQISGLVVNNISTPNYTIFVVGEDGLRVIRGKYRGLYVHEIDHKRWIGCAIGWSKKMLKDNEDAGVNRKGALTEDDKNVFLDIISGKSV